VEGAAAAAAAAAGVSSFAVARVGVLTRIERRLLLPWLRATVDRTPRVVEELAMADIILVVWCVGSFYLRRL
jgi:hypothetical protein